MLVPSEARDQLTQSAQHREEPMVREIAVHTLDSQRCAGDGEEAAGG